MSVTAGVELGNYRFFRVSSYDIDNASSHFRIRSESKTTFFQVRAGNVNLNGIHIRAGVQTCCDLSVFFDCIAADIDNQYRIIFGNLGNDITHDSVYTRVFQSDGAENCGAGFYHSGRNVSVAGI